jgi:RNA polymerase sigma factor (sigma-70 family)
MTGFDDFFGAEYARVVRALALALDDRESAEDAAQEGFARALARWEDVGSMGRPSAWVFVVAMNRARDGLRRARRQPALSAPPPGDPASTVVTAVSLRAALNELPPRQRQAVVLRFLGGLSLAETAEAMDCATGTVKSTLHAALAALRVDLQGWEEAG